MDVWPELQDGFPWMRCKTCFHAAHLRSLEAGQTSISSPRPILGNMFTAQHKKHPFWVKLNRNRCFYTFFKRGQALNAHSVRMYKFLPKRTQRTCKFMLKCTQSMYKFLLKRIQSNLLCSLGRYEERYVHIPFLCFNVH